MNLTNIVLSVKNQTSKWSLGIIPLELSSRLVKTTWHWGHPSLIFLGCYSCSAAWARLGLHSCGHFETQYLHSIYITLWHIYICHTSIKLWPSLKWSNSIWPLILFWVFVYSCLFVCFFIFISDCEKKEQDKTHLDKFKFFGLLISWSIFRI